MLYTIVAVLVLVLDQAVKFWTVKTIPPMAVGGDTVSLIPGVLHMTNVQNDGAAFSILADQRWLLVGVSAVFIIGIIVLISTDVIHTKFGRWTAVLVMAGALGNCIDRVMYGYVVDMFEVELFSFAVFNVADMFITVCGILFCIHVIVYREPAEERNAVPRQARGKVRQLVDEHDDEPYDDGYEEGYEDEYEEEQPRRGKGPKKGRGKKDRPDPYANVPKRGEHRPLAEELRPQDPNDPFAEWDMDSDGEPRQQIAGRRTKAPQPRQEPEQEEPFADMPAVKPAPAPARRPAPQQDPWDDLDMPAEEMPARRAPAPRPAAPAKKPAPAKKQEPLDAGFEEYSLEDILSEFRDS